VDDTSPFYFQATLQLDDSVMPLYADDTFWMDMIPLDSAIAKIDQVEMNKDLSTSVLTYSPSTSEVNTAGVFTVQIYCVRGNGERFVAAIRRVRILANARTLDFTP
jgi:hypothetical protein